MKSAVKILEKKKEYRIEIEKILGKEDCDRIWKRTASRLNGYLKKYENLSEGVRAHTEGSIFPAAAFYLTVKEYLPQEEAFAVMERTADAICGKANRALSKMMRIPGAKSGFIKMWGPMTRKKFGPECGFKNKFYPKEKGAFRVDILECPFKKYLAELGCPELTKVFCDNDERVYGSLPGLVFERKGTLGKGADRCDFYIRKA